jgi:hypothetical protein
MHSARREELAALPGVTWVVGNSHKHQAAEIATSSLCSTSDDQPSGFGGFARNSGFMPLAQTGSQTGQCDCGRYFCAHRTDGGSGI